MNEEKRKARQLDALENIAAELERLRVLMEHELAVRVVDNEGTLNVRPTATE